MDPESQAMAYFEQAIDKESHGSMSDAIDLYRKAFKLHEKIDLLYRHQKVPHSVNHHRSTQGKNSTIKLDDNKVKSIKVGPLLDSFKGIEAKAPLADDLDPDALTIKFANLGNGPDHMVLEPISPLINLSLDIWLYILEILLVSSPESWISMSITCKKFAYLGLNSNEIWRKLCYLIYPRQNYEENSLFIQANQTVGSNITDNSLPVPKDQLMVIPSYNYNWKSMLNERPFIKFLGCYISVVNYYSEGGRPQFSSSWTNPVRVITYYRYLRFYPDGTCVKVLSVLEPHRVVPHLLKYNQLKSIQSALELAKAGNNAPIKDSHRIYHGKWTLSTTGEIHINIEEGTVPYYYFHYHFQIKNLAGVYKYNKLNWIRYYAIRKKMAPDDDREGEVSTFGIRNEKPFKFLRVKSYRVDN